MASHVDRALMTEGRPACFAERRHAEAAPGSECLETRQICRYRRDQIVVGIEAADIGACMQNRLDVEIDEIGCSVALRATGFYRC